MRTLAFKIVGNLHIVVCGTNNPTPQEWLAYVEDFKAGTKNATKIDNMATFVISDGGGPDSAQRKLAADVLDGRVMPVAIVSSNTMMRGVATALSWFNPKVRAFAPAETSASLRYLGVQETKHDATLRTAREICMKAGLPKVASLEAARLATLAGISPVA